LKSRLTLSFSGQLLSDGKGVKTQTASALPHLVTGCVMPYRPILHKPESPAKSIQPPADQPRVPVKIHKFKIPDLLALK